MFAGQNATFSEIHLTSHILNAHLAPPPCWDARQHWLMIGSLHSIRASRESWVGLAGALAGTAPAEFPSSLTALFLLKNLQTCGASLIGRKTDTTLG